MKRSDVADILERFINGTGPDDEWDDFLSIRLLDPFLEEIRVQCNSLDIKFPPEKKGEFCNGSGIQVLKGYVRLLREK